MNAGPPSWEENSHRFVQFLQCIDNAIQDIFFEVTVTVKRENTEEARMVTRGNFGKCIVLESWCVVQVWWGCFLFVMEHRREKGTRLTSNVGRQSTETVKQDGWVWVRPLPLCASILSTTSSLLSLRLGELYCVCVCVREKKSYYSKRLSDKQKKVKRGNN